jgi:hypothetical protein
MVSKLVTMGLVLSAGALTWSGAVADAGEITVAGAVCRSFHPAAAGNLDFQPSGVLNVSPLINDPPIPVVCSIPRPAGTAGVAPMFYVDGQNNPGTCTSCTITIYHFFGTLAASQSFTTCNTATGPLSWDHPVTFSSSAAAISPDDYASALCTIPTGGVIYGVTEFQP